MPYKSEYTHQKIPRELDRRIKLTDLQREEIRWLYINGQTQTALAKLYNVNRTTIRNIVFPEVYEAQLKKYSEEKRSQHYYNKDKQREYMKGTRRYRYSIKEKLC